MFDLVGECVLALWNGVAAERREEYDLWHTREHVPERVSVPGILGARRYRRRSGPLPEYLTLYDIADRRVLSSPPYKQLLDHPTDWSRSMRGSFRGFFRICCRRVATEGGGVGTALAAMVVGEDVDLTSPLLGDVLAEVLRSGPFVATHVLARDPAVPDVPFDIGGPAPEFPRAGVILLEAFDGDGLQSAAPDLAARFRREGLDAGRATLSCYDFAYGLDRESLDRIVTVDRADVAGADEGAVWKGAKS